MQFKATDGSMHPSQKMAYDHSQKPAPADSGDQPKSIMDDPKAMKMVDELKQMGYTADDVEQAMGGGDDSAMQSGQEATAAAPMNIPGVS